MCVSKVNASGSKTRNKMEKERRCRGVGCAGECWVKQRARREGDCADIWCLANKLSGRAKR